MKVKIGKYTGTGVNNTTITGVGFQPNLVLIKRLNTNGDAMFRTSDMAADVTAYTRSDLANVTDGGAIKSFNSDGFVLGTHGNVNDTADYIFIAIKKDTDDTTFTTFTYTGNGSDNRSISGFGFQPDFVMVKGNGANTGSYRFSSQAGDNSSVFYGGSQISNQIQAFESDGIQLGNATEVNNGDGRAYYGFAFKSTTNKVYVGSYTGNSTDDRAISSPGFRPGFVWLKQDDGNSPEFKLASNAYDESQAFDSAVVTNGIQTLYGSGFVVGTGSNVNTSGKTYFYLAVYDPENESGQKQHYYNESESESTTTSSTFQTKVNLKFLPDANATYYIMGNWLQCSDVQGSLGEFKLAKLSATTADYNLSSFDPKDTTDYIIQGGLGIYTAGATPSIEEFAIQYRDNTNAWTKRIKNSRIIAIKKGSNDQNVEYATRHTTTSNGTFVDTNSSSHLTFTPGSTGDYLFLFAADLDYNDTGSYAKARLNIDGTTYHGVAVRFFNATNTKRTYMGMVKVNLTAASHTAKIQFCCGTISDTVGIQNIRIIALRLSDFYNNYYQESLTRTTVLGTAYNDKNTLTTTVVGGKAHLEFNSNIYDQSASSSSTFTQMLSGGSVISEALEEPQNAAARFPYFTFNKANYVGGSYTWKDQYKSESGATSAGSAESRLLAVQIQPSDAGEAQSSNTTRDVRVTGSDTSNDSRDLRVTGANADSVTRDFRITGYDTFFDTIVRESMRTTPSVGSLWGDGIIVDGAYLRTQIAANYVSGGYEFIRTLPSRFAIEFEFWAGGGDGADAVYVYLGCLSTPTSEETAAGGIILAWSEYHDQFRLFEDGGINTNYGYANLDNQTWRKATIIYEDGYFKWKTNEESSFTTAFVGTSEFTGTRNGFGGRTGGLNNEHRIRNLVYSEPTNYRDLRITGATADSVSRDFRITGLSSDSTDTRDLRITGQDVSSVNRDLRTTGSDTSSANRDARITGSDTSNITRDFRVTGQNTSSDSRDVRVSGSDVSNTTRDVRIQGQDISSVSRDIRTTGSDVSSANRDLRLTGLDTSTVTRDFRITGSDISSVNRDVRVTGQDSSSTNRDLRVTGQDTSSVSRDFRISAPDGFPFDRDLRITGTADDSVNRDVRITGKEDSNASRDFRIRGQDSSSVSRDFRITGKQDDSRSQDIRITGKDDSSASRDIRITAKDDSSVTRDFRVTGKADSSADRGVRVTGADTSNAARDVRITGLDNNSVDRGLRITAQDQSSVNRDFRVTGKDESTTSRDLRLTGKDETTVERGLRLSGQETSEIDRVIKVVGASVSSDERVVKIIAEDYSNISISFNLFGIDSSSTSRGLRIVGEKAKWNKKNEQNYYSKESDSWYSRNSTKWSS